MTNSPASATVLQDSADSFAQDAPHVQALPADTCLQCGQTKAEVKGEESSCVVVTGYEYSEVEAEWDRHHWRNWSNKELAATLILPGFWELYRRVSIYDLHWVPCVHSSLGHRMAEKDVDEFRVVASECFNCGIISPV